MQIAGADKSKCDLLRRSGERPGGKPRDVTIRRQGIDRGAKPSEKLSRLTHFMGKNGRILTCSIECPHMARHASSVITRFSMVRLSVSMKPSIMRPRALGSVLRFPEPQQQRLHIRFPSDTNPLDDSSALVATSEKSAAGRVTGLSSRHVKPWNTRSRNWLLTLVIVAAGSHELCVHTPSGVS